MLVFAMPSFCSSVSAALAAAASSTRRIVAPLWTAARWNSPFAAGVPSSVDVFEPPPD